MVGTQENLEALIKKKVYKVGHEPLHSPLAHLVVHAGGTQFHAVHNLVDLVDYEPRNTYFRVRQQLSDLVDVTVPKPLRVSYCISC